MSTGGSIPVSVDNTSLTPTTPINPRPFVFDFDENPVRVVEREDGQVWFVAADVCRVLEIVNHRDAVSRLDEDEKGVGISETAGGPQEMLIISESGMYTLIFTSRKPEAQRFRKWVAGEVLPAIRKTGGYLPGNRQLSPGETAEVFRTLADLTSRVDELTARLATPSRGRRIVEVIPSQKEMGKAAALLAWLAREIPMVSIRDLPPFKLKDGFLIIPPKAIMAFMAIRPCPVKIYSSFHLVSCLVREGFLSERNRSRSIDGRKCKCVLISLAKLEQAGIPWPDCEPPFTCIANTDRSKARLHL